MRWAAGAHGWAPDAATAVGTYGWNSEPDRTATGGASVGAALPIRKAAQEALVRLRGPAGNPLTAAQWLQCCWRIIRACRRRWPVMPTMPGDI
ncbi:hypothetical protein GCM10010191_59320 [Actinomadura vinacea]|uniref:Uncharacterized protein n=1 Tax=Actinomadura vinacea TaxID=115336 RepID=A0ABN3JSC3_9ACTN